MVSKQSTYAKGGLLMPSIVIPANTMEGIVDVIRELAALNDTELLQVLNETLNSTVNIALAAAKGQDYIIQSKEEAARQKARDAFEHKKECASKEWSKYISTEDYSRVFRRSLIYNM
jgi:hypothetical protein